MGNFGLHSSRADASIQGVTVGGAADLMKRVKTYENHQEIKTTGIYDVKTKIKKEAISHWIMKNVK